MIKRLTIFIVTASKFLYLNKIHNSKNYHEKTNNKTLKCPIYLLLYSLFKFRCKKPLNIALHGPTQPNPIFVQQGERMKYHWINQKPTWEIWTCRIRKRAQRVEKCLKKGSIENMWRSDMYIMTEGLKRRNSLHYWNNNQYMNTQFCAYCLGLLWIFTVYLIFLSMKTLALIKSTCLSAPPFQ